MNNRNQVTHALMLALILVNGAFAGSAFAFPNQGPESCIKSATNNNPSDSSEEADKKDDDKKDEKGKEAH